MQKKIHEFVNALIHCFWTLVVTVNSVKSLLRPEPFAFREFFYSTAALLFSKALFQNTNVLFMPYLMQLVRTMHISHVINECWVWNVVWWKLQHIVLQKTLFRFRKATLHVTEIVIALSIVTTTHNTSDIQCCVSHV